MATPSPTASSEFKYDKLSELYLALWKQLDRTTDDGKWLEIRPESGSALTDEIRKTVDALAPCFGDPDLWSVVYKDYEKAQDFMFGSAHVNKAEVDAFRTYLRDHGLRYAQLADEAQSATEK